MLFFFVSTFCFALCAFGRRPAFDFEGDIQGWKLLEGEDANAVNEIFVDDSVASEGYHSLGVLAQFPGIASVYTYIQRDDMSIYEKLEMDVYIPPDIPDDISANLFVQDAEWLWYQTRAFSLIPGEWQTISADMSPHSMAWKSLGHSQPWGSLSRSNLNTMGIMFVSNGEFRSRLNIDNIVFKQVMFPEHTMNVSELQVGEKLELAFNLPATYCNPFDPVEIAVEGKFIDPAGKKIVVPGFFYQNYERRVVIGEDGGRREALDPEGAPTWKIRFTPVKAGSYFYSITAADRSGTRSSANRRFYVTPGAPPGFVRTDPDNDKGFQLDCGSYFFPIGFNYRSPYDVRYEQNILGRRLTDPGDATACSNVALDDGTFGFEENMVGMAEYGMNFMETWMAPWWIALEWSPQRMGFRGAAWYNLRNAWKLDRIMNAAGQHGIYIQLVLINHGQLSTFVDQEWQDHPYNVQNGGFLMSPEDFFSDPHS